MKSKSRLLVIVVTYNGMKWLNKCLTSVKESSIAAELFIVDNGSSDGSIEFIRKNYPDAKLVESKENLGFGKANNLGFRYALDNQFDYIYLLNQDAWVDVNTFETLIKVQKDNPHYGIISPLQINAAKTKLDRIFNEYLPKTLTSDCIMNVHLKQLYQTDFVMAAHWLISNHCLNQIGGFSPSFPHYGEDDNYIHRTIFHGLKVGICPYTKAVHDREFRKETKKHIQYMKYIYFLKIYSNPLLKNRLKLSFKYLITSILGTNKMCFSDILKIIKSLPFLRQNFKRSLETGKHFLT